MKFLIDVVQILASLFYNINTCKQGCGAGAGAWNRMKF